jgi:toxin ParE1/3/4
VTPLSVKPVAIEDVRQHIAHIASNRPDAADRFATAVEDAFAMLAVNPELGACKTMSNDALTGLRIWTMKGFRNYAIFYRFQGKAVEVLRVLHAARDWESLLDLPPPQ